MDPSPYRHNHLVPTLEREQSRLRRCKLESGKDIMFNPEDDDFEHQLDLRMACVDASTKDELHVVEVEGQDEEGQKITAVLASLKPSTLPSVCLGGFTITPPAVFRLKAGPGPIHISGQHLVIMEGDQSFEEEDDEGEEEEEEEVEEDVPASKKRPAPSPVSKKQKKVKKDEEEEDEDEDDEDEDEDDMEDSPVQAKPEPKAQTPAQNGKGSKPNTPAKNQPKTPNKGSPKAPKTPKKTPTIDEVKQQIMEFVKKGRVLPKVQPKFENYVKNAYKVSDAKVIEDLWKWKQTLKE
ncbi:Nucleophosmin [Merluccius polli]|uniref:Nucleophosmin n=1 Tax=Merluccius polli TaxID=89951 RepID=A0AA47P260_MERPO|nr:Nucleophosmin [Merluccius polli]